MHFSIVICWKPCQYFFLNSTPLRCTQISMFLVLMEIQKIYSSFTKGKHQTSCLQHEISFGFSYIFLEDYSVTCWKTLFTFILRIKWLICYSGRLYFEHRSAAYHEHVQRTVWSIERTSHSVRLWRRSWHIFFDPGPNYSALGCQISNGKS